MTESIRRIRLFIGSYAPLFLLLAIRFTPRYLWIACLIIGVYGILDMAWIVYITSRGTGPDPIRIATVRDAGAEISGYLATYLLPFLTVSTPTVRDVLAYIGFLFIVGLLYVRSEMTQINPTLYMLGRKVVHISTDSDWDGYLIVASSPVTPGTVMLVTSLNPAIRVEAVHREG